MSRIIFISSYYLSAGTNSSIIHSAPFLCGGGYVNKQRHFDSCHCYMDNHKLLCKPAPRQVPPLNDIIIIEAGVDSEAIIQ